MRSALFVLAPLVLSAIAGVSQNLSTPLLLSPAADSFENCPVNLHAEQQPAGSTLAARPSKWQGATQALHLTLRNQDFRNIASLELDIYGVSPGGRVAPLAALHASGDAVRRVRITPQIPPSDSAESDVTVPDFSAVRKLVLVAVTFADGVMWHASSHRQCATVPDPFMLVAESR